MIVPLWVWIAVVVAIAAIFVVSLLFGRTAHLITVGEAARWVAGYVCLAGLFGLGILFTAGSRFAGEFFAGYVTEYALSVDNLFVFAIILTAFRVPREFQGKVVLIGIGIALVLRAGLIAGGAALISRFSWVFYLFGLFLVIASVNMAREKEVTVAEPRSVRILRRILPMSADYVGGRFLVRQEGRIRVTPLLAVILALGVTDLVFALDSIPAIFGLTKQAFLVFTANAFALLGLSEMYFLLGALLDRLRYLGRGLSVILLFIGLKLISEALAENSLPFIAGGGHVDWAPDIGPGVSLAVVGGILLVTVVASVVAARVEQRRAVAAARLAGHPPPVLADLGDDPPLVVAAPGDDPPPAGPTPAGQVAGTPDGAPPPGDPSSADHARPAPPGQPPNATDPADTR